MLHRLGSRLEADRVTTIEWLRVKRFVPTSSLTIRVYDTLPITITTWNSLYSSSHLLLYYLPTESNAPPQKNGHRIPAAKSRKAKAAQDPFRFLDLPRELRDKVYENLLCSFAPPHDAATNPFPKYTSTVHPAILRCNKQIHREAYGIMVKTNRFIHVKLHGDICNIERLLEFMEANTRRIISRNTWAVDHFRGFVLEVDIVLEGTGWPGGEENLAVEGHAMILQEDVTKLLSMLERLHEPKAQMTLGISLTVAPDMDTRLASYKESLQPFFSDRTQELLLRPFRDLLRGVQSIKVIGASTQLAKAVEADIAQHKCTDHKQFLANLNAAGKRGIDFFQRNDLDAAIEVWEHMICELNFLYNSSSWSGLCASGGIPFAASIADSLFSTCMNILHAEVLRHKKSNPGFTPKQRVYDLCRRRSEQDHLIEESGKENHWMDGYTWVPSQRQAGRMCFTQTQVTMAAAQLENDIKWLVNAWRYLHFAAELLPDDDAIKRTIREADECMEEMADNMTEAEKQKVLQELETATHIPDPEKWKIQEELAKAQSRKSGT